MRCLILGFVRPELNYVSKDALIDDIRTDIAVTRRSLDRESYQWWKADRWLVER
jgi:riboflavin kinase